MQAELVSYQQKLANYLPENCTKPISEWLIASKATLRITKARSTKFGDYRPPTHGKGHRISINHNLNRYAFLITLVHEIAHLHNWNHYGNKVKPHGKEWKKEFSQLLFPFLKMNVFPKDIAMAVQAYIQNPAASTCSDPDLFKVLRRYDAPSDTVFLEELPHGAIFSTQNKRIFRKGEQLRKRFKCEEIKTGRQYLFSPLADVLFLSNKGISG